MLMLPLPVDVLRAWLGFARLVAAVFAVINSAGALCCPR